MNWKRLVLEETALHFEPSSMHYCEQSQKAPFNTINNSRIFFIEIISRNNYLRANVALLLGQSERYLMQGKLKADKTCSYPSYSFLASSTLLELAIIKVPASVTNWFGFKSLRRSHWNRQANNLSPVSSNSVEALHQIFYSQNGLKS